MDGATSPEVRAVAEAMDSGLTDVMPDTWHGHARMSIFSRDDLSDKQMEFAEVLSKRLLKKNDITADKAAEAAIDQAIKKL